MVVPRAEPMAVYWVVRSAQNWAAELVASMAERKADQSDENWVVVRAAKLAASWADA